MTTFGRHVAVVGGLCVLLAACSGGADDPGTGLPDRRAEAETWAAFHQARDECMGDKGFPVTVFDDGGRSFEGAGTLDRDELLALLGECADIAGGEPPTVPLVDAEVNQFYDRQVEAYHCLIDHGYDPPEPPTREVYLAS